MPGNRFTYGMPEDANNEDPPTDPLLVRRFAPDGKEVEPIRRVPIEALGSDVARQVREHFAKDPRRRETFGEYRQPIQIVHKAQRHVIVGNTAFHLKERETLADFLISLACSVFDAEWYDAERIKTAEKRHPFAQWFMDMRKFQVSVEADESGYCVGKPSAAMMAVLRMGYDLFIVLDNTGYLAHTLKKLRHRDQFQGARYELTVGAVLTIAGFKVSYIDENDAPGMSAELRAKHQSNGVELIVEAKSRHNARAKTPDCRLPDGTWRLGFGRTLKKAFAQLEANSLPGVVFQELDLPCLMPNDPGKDAEVFGKTAINEVAKAAAKYRKARKPEPVNLVVLTNQPYHNEAAYALNSKPQDAVIMPQTPTAVPLDLNVVVPLIRSAFARYQYLPATWEDFGDAPPGLRIVKSQQT